MSAIEMSRQTIQKLYTKIELLNKNNAVIDELEGLVVGGNISIDATSDIRRTCDLEILLNNEQLLPKNEVSKIWYDKRFKLLIGIEDLSTGNIEYYNKGIYYFNSPNISMSSGGSFISIQGVDKIYTLKSEGNGALGYMNKIEADTPFFDAIKNILLIGGENNYSINDVENLFVPYEITKSSEDSIYDILVELRDLYMGYEFFYDVDGVFVWQKIKDRKNDTVQYSYDENDKSIITYNNSPDWDNVKNKVIVWGCQFEDKEQISYVLENKRDNIFGSDYIGERLLVVNDDTVQSQEQAQMMAEYKLHLHGNLNESVSLETIQILDFDVNRIVSIKNPSIAIDGNYLVENISYSLGNEGTMSIGGRKLYY